MLCFGDEIYIDCVSVCVCVVCVCVCGGGVVTVWLSQMYRSEYRIDNCYVKLYHMHIEKKSIVCSVGFCQFPQKIINEIVENLPLEQRINAI